MYCLSLSISRGRLGAERDSGIGMTGKSLRPGCQTLTNMYSKNNLIPREEERPWERCCSKNLHLHVKKLGMKNPLQSEKNNETGSHY